MGIFTTVDAFSSIIICKYKDFKAGKCGSVGQSRDAVQYMEISQTIFNMCILHILLSSDPGITSLYINICVAI